MMKRRLGLLLATAMVVSTMATVAYGWTNPLKNYNLYDDVNPQSNDEREQVMSDYINQNRNNSYTPPSMDSFSSDEVQLEAPKTRNETLRESSRNVYADPEVPAGWTEGPSFYPNPSFNSIVAKYKKSDFAGCLQECISYVRQHPNDTLGFYYLAMCYTKVSDMDNAVKAYERVIELNDNPMIVKYATNGRNCIMGNEAEKCYPRVNEPELVYPYANLPYAQLTPIDPQTLVEQNINSLKATLSPLEADKDDENNSDPNNKNDEKNKKVKLPFGKQDSELDEFINAPYGNGLAPKLNNEYKQLQLKKIQSTINTGDEGEQDKNNMKYIKDFDKQKSDAGETIKLAYEIPQKEIDAISKDPEFVKAQQEYNELRMLLGSDNSSNYSNNMSDMLPYMNESDAKNISPEAIQNMMMRSMMGDLNL